jgi:hypothetical protein
MLRDALEDNNSDHQAPGAPTTTTSYHSITSLRQAKGEDERSRSSNGMKTNQY